MGKLKRRKQAPQTAANELPAPARWSRLLWWLAAGLIVANLSLAPVVGTETDIWWQLSAGQRFWQHGLELVDPYSFTQANQPWIRIDWLFQAIIYAVYSLGGMSGLLILRSASILAASGVVGFLVRRRPLAEAWMLVMLTGSIWCQSVSLRPATASFFFTALWVLVLEQARAGKTRWLWALPPLLVVWFNLHVASLAGLLLLGLYGLGHLLECWRARRRPEPIWLQVLGLCFLAPLLNPQGWKTAYLPIHFLLVKSPWRDIILEVQPARWSWPGTWQAELLLVLSALGALARLRQGQITPILVTVACGVLSNLTYRHQFQLCVCLVPWAALWLPRPLQVVTALVAGLWSVQAFTMLVFLRWPLEGLVRRESFSESLVTLARRGQPGLRVFTDLNTAGYFIWNFAGEQKVFIDTRTDQVYARPEFLGEYLEIWLGGSHALELLDRYQVQAVANNRVTSGGSPLFQKLQSSPDWACVLSDMTGELYCRKELAGQFGESKSPVYLSEFARGAELYQQGRWEEAQASWQRSLRDYPQFASAYQFMGRVWMQQGQKALARRALARAELYHPQTPGLSEDWRRLGQDWPDWLRVYLLPFWAI